MDKKEVKKKVNTAAAGAGAVLSILTAAKYDNPAELIKEEIKKNDDHAIEEKAIIEKSEIKEYAVNKIPAIIRTIVLLPMWFIGHFLLGLLDKLVKLVASPVIAFLLSTLFTFLILLLIIVLFIKLLFPDMPLKKILNKKLIIGVLISSLLINVIDRILLAKIESYINTRKIITFFLGLLVLILILLNVIKRKLKEEKEPKIIYGEI